MISFWKKKAEVPPLAPVQPTKERFKSDMSRIKSLLEMEETIVGKVALLEFVIRVIGRELEAENTAQFFRVGIADSQDGSEHRIPMAKAIQKHKQVSLSPYNVISRPWNDSRIVPAVVKEFVYGHRSDWNSCDGMLYQELGLVVVSNGRHHLTVAKFKDDAVADLEVYSLKDSFPNLHTDGEYWYYEQDGFPQKDVCRDHRLAVLYELARKRWELSQDCEIPELSHRPKCINESNCEWYTLCDLLQTKTEEIHFLKTENELLRRRLKQSDSAPEQ